MLHESHVRRDEMLAWEPHLQVSEAF